MKQIGKPQSQADKRTQYYLHSKNTREKVVWEEHTDGKILNRNILPIFNSQGDFNGIM